MVKEGSLGDSKVSDVSNGDAKAPGIFKRSYNNPFDVQAQIKKLRYQTLYSTLY